MPRQTILMYWANMGEERNTTKFPILAEKNEQGL
jgi:hypothetical protein